ncbi:MAG: thioredoxin-dependent thiol peroxidase [Ignavibacteriales bacterium]|nr:thioredoxin-dependent thiol peroxidase [Ignavibacteriales bacterium]
MIETGDKAPEFELPSSDGTNVSLNGFRGRRVILYFYPKDNTPGCTKEACSFNDNLSRLKRNGVVVLGISADSVTSHQKFAAKYGLRFPLLSDESKEVLNAYGVWKKKSLYGRTFMGIERTTFLIDEDGRIRAIFPRVKVDGHTEEILAALKSF